MGISGSSHGIKYVFTQATAPTGVGEVEGSLWYDTSKNELFTYDGAVWVAVASTNVLQLPTPVNNWEFNNDATDEEGVADLTPEGSVEYDSTNKKTGTHAYLNSDGGAAKGHEHLTYLDNINTLYGDKGITLSMWIRPTNVTGVHHIFSKLNAWNGTKDRFELYLDGTTLTCQFYAASSGSTMTETISINTWAHVVIVWKDDGDICMYVNGVEVDDDSTCSQIMDDGSGWNLHIGMDANGASDFYGQIDTVKFFGLALEELEVKNLFTLDGGVR